MALGCLRALLMFSEFCSWQKFPVGAASWTGVMTESARKECCSGFHLFSARVRGVRVYRKIWTFRDPYKLLSWSPLYAILFIHHSGSIFSQIIDWLISWLIDCFFPPTCYSIRPCWCAYGRTWFNLIFNVLVNLLNYWCRRWILLEPVSNFGQILFLPKVVLIQRRY